MTVITRTVTVNAAFLLEIKEDAEELRDLLRRLEDCLLIELPARMTRRQLFVMLCQLRDQLAMHFALEEAYGYFEDAIEVAPRMSMKADRLRCEHSTFYTLICDIVEQAERLLHREVPPRVHRQVVSRLGEFFESFQQHEYAENQLIQQAFNEDVGGWD